MRKFSILTSCFVSLTLGVEESMRTKVVLAIGLSARLKKHRVNPEFLGDKFGKQAARENKWIFEIDLGFDPSELDPDGPRSEMSECALVISSPLGISVVVVGKIPGVHYSFITAASRCVPYAGWLWDKRVGDKKRRLATEALEQFHASHWNDMEILAAVSQESFD